MVVSDGGGDDESNWGVVEECFVAVGTCSDDEDVGSGINYGFSGDFFARNIGCLGYNPLNFAKNERNFVVDYCFHNVFY